jgi:hypothetical protein
MEAKARSDRSDYYGNPNKQGCTRRWTRRNERPERKREREAEFANLGVEHDGTNDAGDVHSLTEVVECLLVVLVRAVGKVEPRDAHAGAQQARAHLDGARGRAEGADDLGLGPAPPYLLGPLGARHCRRRRLGDDGEGGGPAG